MMCRLISSLQNACLFFLVHIYLIYPFHISHAFFLERCKRRGPKVLEANKGFGVVERDQSVAKLSANLHISCPCCSGLSYEHCCYPLHSKAVNEEQVTPDQTVRARFSAYSIGYGEYLLSTLHPTSDVSLIYLALFCSACICFPFY